MTERVISAPTIDPENAFFWAQASEGRFFLPFCDACGETHWYPRAVCPVCFKGRTGWREASGEGEVYSYSVTRVTKTPYVIAYVTLKEGPTMMTNIVDCAFEDIRVGMPVRVVFKPSDGGPLVPMFRPA